MSKRAPILVLAPHTPYLAFQCLLSNLFHQPQVLFLLTFRDELGCKIHVPNDENENQSNG